MASTELPSLKAETERMQSRIDMVRDRYVDNMWKACNGDKKYPHHDICANPFFEALFPMSRLVLDEWIKHLQTMHQVDHAIRQGRHLKMMVTVCMQSAYEVLDNAPTDLEMVVLLANVLGNDVMQDTADSGVKLAHGYAIKKGVWTKTT